MEVLGNTRRDRISSLDTISLLLPGESFPEIAQIRHLLKVGELKITVIQQDSKCIPFKVVYCIATYFKGEHFHLDLKTHKNFLSAVSTT